jgi:putative PEP-CTERM system TPR-repeat lipoprotein
MVSMSPRGACEAREMSMTNRLGALLGATLLSAILVGPAIGADASPADSLRAAAEKSLLKGDLRTALIQLKNAVQADTHDGAARYALGSVELRLGDLLSAEKDLRAARAFEYDRDKTDVALAETLLRMNRSQDVLSEFNPINRPPAIAANLLVTRGYALIILKRPEEAKAVFENARALAPNPTRALLGLAHVAAAAGDTTGALALAQQSIDSDGKVSDAWLYSAQLLRAKNDLPEARRRFDIAVSLSPENESARLDRAALLVALGEIPLASTDVHSVLLTTPHQPLANYLLALIEAKNKNYRAAESALQAIPGDLSNYPPALYLQAAVELAQDQFAQAESAINRFLTSEPNDEAGVTLLANLLAKRGNTSREIEVLTDANPTVQILGLLASAYLQDKQPEAAAAVADRIEALGPTDDATKTQLAELNLRLGRTGATGSAVATAAGVPLILTLLQENKTEAATQAALALAAKTPTDPLPENLLGAIAIKAGDAAAARGHFEKSLTIQPDFAPARDNLARLVAAETKLADARVRMGAALIAMKRYEDAIPLYEALLKDAPEMPVALNNLAWLYQQKHDDRALAIAERALKAAPESNDAEDTLGWILVQKGDNSRGLEILEKIATPVPDARYHLAVALNNAGRKADAVAALDALPGPGTPFDGRADAETLRASFTKKL